jgi:hypothetical protein
MSARPFVDESSSTSEAPSENPPTDKDTFMQQASAILWRWRRLEYLQAATTRSSHHEQRDDELVRKTYDLIQRTIREQPEVIAALAVQPNGKRLRGPSISDQPIKQALRAICTLRVRPEYRAHGYPDLPKYLACPKRRNELGDAMAYAFRHQVPSRFFIAFYQHAGIPRIKEMQRLQLWEPGFEVPKRARTLAERRASGMANIFIEAG